jgi:hypothetical protein
MATVPGRVTRSASGARPRRGLAVLATETKPSILSTEFYAWVASVVGILIAAASVDNLNARQAWLYVSIVTAGYMISRGLAKSGSHFPAIAEDDDPRPDRTP